MMAVTEDLANLFNGSFVAIGGDRLDDDVVDETGREAFSGRRKVAGHGRVRNEELGVIRAGAVTAVLLLVFEHADNGVWIASNHERLADDALPGEELAIGFRTEKDNAGPVGFVVGGEETPLLYME